MINKFIPVNEPLLDGNEEKYLIECVRSGWISSEGPFVTMFEEKFATQVGRDYGVAVCNGSVALDLAVKVLDISSGDEVIMPSHTIISCPAAVVRAGATPVLVDCDPITYNMNISEVESKISLRTKAIMVVHIFGLPVDMNPLLSLAKKYGLKVIEDAAEAHGQTYRGAPCGSFGDISTFSFYSNKHITTGEGGMVVTNDPHLADKLKYYRNLCFNQKQRFIHDDLGWNFRMSNLQAAVGVAQLENLDKVVSRKRKMGERYDELLKDVKAIQLPLKATEYSKNIYWVYPIVVRDEIFQEAKYFMDLLNKEGIGTRPFFWPINKQPVFNNLGLFLEEEYPISEKIAKRGFYLPSGVALTEEQIDFVAKKVQNIFD